MQLTKTQSRIVEAIDRGYLIVNGELFGPRGKLAVRLAGTQRYPTFSTNWDGVYGVPVHQFAAYQYFGARAFDPTLVVRHLNGNVLDYSEANILLGTPSENNLDKPQSVRQAAARKARASQPTTPNNAKLLPHQVAAIRSAYSGLLTKKAPNGFTKQLCTTYGVSRTVINKIIQGKYYREC